MRDERIAENDNRKGDSYACMEAPPGAIAGLAIIAASGLIIGLLLGLALGWLIWCA